VVQPPALPIVLPEPDPEPDPDPDPAVTPKKSAAIVVEHSPWSSKYAPGCDGQLAPPIETAWPMPATRYSSTLSP